MPENQGFTDKATCWVGTQAGSVGDGTGTGKTNVNDLMVTTIVFSAKISDDALVLKEGTDTDTVLKLEGPAVVNFGKGKHFSGLYVDSITSGASVYIFFA